MPEQSGGHVARDLFFTLPPAGFFLILYLEEATPFNWLFLALSVTFFVLAVRVVLSRPR
jgi:succinate-acetate transporter protein